MPVPPPGVGRENFILKEGFEYFPLSWVRSTALCAPYELEKEFACLLIELIFFSFVSSDKQEFLGCCRVSDTPLHPRKHNGSSSNFCFSSFNTFIFVSA
jgi:hypothetical protein